VRLDRPLTSAKCAGIMQDNYGAIDAPAAAASK
jgi:hypothetical protein